jgi:hypothetical protein
MHMWSSRAMTSFREPHVILSASWYGIYTTFFARSAAMSAAP